MAILSGTTYDAFFPPSKWDIFYLKMAHQISSMSKDPSTQTGAVIVRPDKSVVSVGFNGFPKDMPDDPALYADREQKYSRIVHCEMNALLFTKEPVSGYTLYTWPFASCDRCCVAMLQAGFTRFVFPELPEHLKERWQKPLDLTKKYIGECRKVWLEIKLNEIYPDGVKIMSSPTIGSYMNLAFDRCVHDSDDPGTIKWNKRFMRLAEEIGEWSKDDDRKVGCLIVGPHREIRSAGYNGFPRGVNDDLTERHLEPAKYLWTEHPERNAIYNAAMIGIPLENCTIYVAGFPCMDCARAIIQSGIKTVVAYEPNFNNPKWGEDYRNTLAMFSEVGIYVYYASKE